MYELKIFNTKTNEWEIFSTISEYSVIGAELAIMDAIMRGMLKPEYTNVRADPDEETQKMIDEEVRNNSEDCE